jgi:SSS family solute:Na+ symporter
MGALRGIDAAVLLAYLLLTTGLGLWLGRGQRSGTDYFLGGRRLPWLLVAFSVVATETSTLTVISVPGLAYTGDLTFLQLAFGYILGRIAAALLLLPFFYRHETLTAYGFLGRRFGILPQRTASVLFLVTRILADGVRLFATAIPLALITGWSYPLCILAIGGVTVLYTWVGGIRSVVWLDAVQLVLYLTGALVALGLVLGSIGGWSGLMETLPAGKLRMINLGLSEGWRGLFGGGYRLPAALIGGAFLSMASHGTDQLLVQRLLATRGLRQAQTALIVSGFLVLVQFLVFLILGATLYVAFGGAPMASDEVFPRFIIERLPAGLAGLVLAAIFAAAMSTLSSSLNALSSSTVLDLFRRRDESDDDQLRRGRRTTLFWAVVLVGGAMLFHSTDNPVVELGLSIASVTYGGFLAAFLLGRLTSRGGPAAAVAALIVGSGTGAVLWIGGFVFWVWLVPAGCLAGLLVGWLVAWIDSRPSTP